MRVFLTGGSGLIGSHAAFLLREEGHGVVVLRREGSDTAYLASLGCEFVDGDVRDPIGVLAPLMQGCTHVVHSAALVYAGGDWAEVHAVNVQGTANVLGAAAKAGVGHAVHVSSVAVYGSADPVVDERTALDAPIPTTDFYARSKREAEVEARRVEAEAGMPVTVLRPASVYGERDRLLTVRIARMVRRPLTFLMGGGRNTIPTVYAGNVATAVSLALAAQKGGAVYDVGMDHPLTQRDMMLGIARGLGTTPRLVPIPGTVVRAGAAALGAMGVSTPGAKHLALARVVRLALGENPFVSRLIREELGWKPPHRHEDALERAGRWLTQTQ